MPDQDPSATDSPNRFGEFFQTYHAFLSSIMIGLAGLVATSIWQYRQAETSARQATSEAHIAQVQAENSWRIERAEILSKNLSILSSSGPDSAEERFGVLLSLTRGNIIDPELAVSYALELGKDSPTYMKSVLVSTADKSYARLAAAYELTCEQRFGVTREVALCPADNHAERSLALSDLIADEIELAQRQKRPGPIEALLPDERSVQNNPLKLSALFAPYLTDLFERRQEPDVQRFEASSIGAHLVGALVLAPTPPSAFVAASEATDIDAFHDAQAAWLRSYLFGATCSGECKGKLVEIMLSSYADSQGRYDAAMHELFVRPRGEVAMALARLHSRLLLCQASLADSSALRDQVLVPTLAEIAKRGNESDATVIEDLLSLLSLTVDPSLADAPDAIAQRTAWSDALEAARTVLPELYHRAFTQRRKSVQITRKAPPARFAHGMFCTADEVELQTSRFKIEQLTAAGARRQLFSFSRRR